MKRGKEGSFTQFTYREQQRRGTHTYTCHCACGWLFRVFKHKPIDLLLDPQPTRPARPTREGSLPGSVRSQKKKNVAAIKKPPARRTKNRTKQAHRPGKYQQKNYNVHCSMKNESGIYQLIHNSSIVLQPGTSENLEFDNTRLSSYYE